MFKNWAGWLGAEKERVTGEPVGINKPSDQQSNTEKDAQLLQKAAGFSGYIYNFASSASKKLSESVAETAQTLKKSVEEGKISGIIDKTILGDFQKEQEKFVEEKRAKEFGAAVPPWVGYNEEAAIQEQILALSADKRNFLRDPPAGVQFHFEFDQMYPVAMVMLEEDELLRKMRFHLVPKQVKEKVFWKNYFYRVSLIKQSAQLTALAAQQAAERRDVKKTSSSCEDPHRKDVVKQKASSLKPKSNEINEDDLRKEMEQLVLDNAEQEEMPDWERELQEELQEYDVLADGETHDDIWDREIEEMLKEES